MFRSQLLWRFYAGYVAVILISTLIVGVLVSRQVTKNSLEDIQHSLAVRTEFLAVVATSALSEWPSAGNQSNTVSPIAVTLQKKLEGLGDNTESRLTVILMDGTVLADSQESPQIMDNHAGRPEIVEANKVGAATVSRYSKTLKQQMMYRAQAVNHKGREIGFVRVSLPLTAIDSKLAQLRLIVLFAALVVAGAALLIGFYFAKHFSDPLIKMTEVAEAISRGDYDKRITIKSNDEIGQLAKAFNRMAKISARRMAEITMDRNRLAMIFAGMSEGVIAVNEQQEIIHINEAALKLLNLSVVNCLNKPVWEHVRIQEINNALEKTMATKYAVKTQLRRPSETSDLVVDIYAAVLSDDAGDMVGAVIVLNDISDVDRLERVRRDFVANASHELKTPITAIRGLSETILDDEEMEDSIRLSFIEKIKVQSIRLSSLVIDLMTLSRLESGNDDQNVQPVDLTDVVRRSCAGMKMVCQDKGLSLSLEFDSDKHVVIPGDIQTISQLVDNLIDNAIKYTPDGGGIAVLLREQDGKARFEVKDSGIGISPQYQKRVFERFYRIDKARSRELGGTGLGLSIVKNIAEHHGGSISLVSQPGVGSTFIVTLPM